MEEINSYIINTDPYKKRIEVKIHFNTYLPELGMVQLISITGVNKSVRPIMVTNYGFHITDQNFN